MDPTALLGFYSTVIPYTFLTAQITYAAFSYILSKQYSTLRRNHSFGIALFINAFLPSSATQFERVEKVILNGDDDDALAFKQAVTDECSMNAVAVG